jgi:hypothetical protein
LLGDVSCTVKVAEAPEARDSTVIGDEELLQVELGGVMLSLTEVTGERPVLATVMVTVAVPPGVVSML